VLRNKKSVVEFDVVRRSVMRSVGRSAIVVALLAGALALKPQTSQAAQVTSLSGQVTNDVNVTNVDVSGLDVQVDIRDAPTISTKTDRSGRFSLLGLAGGEAIVTVNLGPADCRETLYLDAGHATRTNIAIHERYAGRYTCSTSATSTRAFDAYIMRFNAGSEGDADSPAFWPTSLVGAISPGTGSLIGTVRDSETRALLAGVAVSARSLGKRSQLIRTTTDAAGRFTFPALPRGDCWLYFDLKGYPQAWVIGLLISENDETNFRMLLDKHPPEAPTSSRIPTK
jgi:hypothetical protein